MTVATGYDPRPGVEDAKRAIEAAKEAEAAASARVDYCREEASVGRATTRDLHRARNALARAQEATGQAEARVRALIRDAEAAQVADADRREEARGDLVAELEIEREAIVSEVVPLAAAFVQGLDQVYLRAADWSVRARAVPGPPPPTRPNSNPPRVGSVATLTNPECELVNARDAARRLVQAATPRR